MTWSALRLPRASVLWIVVCLALLGAACARHAAPVVAKPGALLVPTDLAMGFLQGIKSQPARSLLQGEATIPPCRFTEKGTWSAGEYRKLTGQRAPTQITAYGQWILFKIEDAEGRDFRPLDLDGSRAWSYSLRTPQTARTVFGTTDHCIVGPTAEPARKVVEALAALGVAIAPEYGYIVR